MAIRAPYLALCNLLFDYVPRRAPDEHADFAVLQLWVAVVELENQWIGFSAVHARVRS